MKKDEGKILGVLGGMGPAATHLFYKMIVEMTEAHADQEHLNMIILNHATIPDRTGAILKGTTDEVLEAMAADIKYLEDGGADFIAIPCNTSHVLIDRLSVCTTVPIINMIDETAKAVKEICGKTGDNETGSKVGIMATTGTIETELYQKACVQKGLTPVIPSEEEQALVMKLIYDGVKDGGEINRSDFDAVADSLKEKGCEAIILGCTELSVLREMFDLPGYFVDAMEVLARESIERCDKNIRNKMEAKK